MICPYCQSKNYNNDPFNDYGAIYSCIDKYHKFYYRGEYNFILILTKYPYHMLAQNQNGCEFSISKPIHYSYGSFCKEIVNLKLKPMHYSKAYNAFKRVINLKSFT